VTRLFGVEWRRMWARQLPWALIIIVSGVMVVSGIASFVRHNPNPPDTSGRDEQVAEQVAQCRSAAIDEWNRWDSGEVVEQNPDYVAYLSQFDNADAFADSNCAPEFFGDQIDDPRFCLVAIYEPTVQYRDGCPDVEGAHVSEYTEARFTINGREYRTARPVAGGIVPTASLVLLGVAAVIGASFIGAEYAAGTIETTLIWEPRRRRVLAAKFAVAALTAFAIHVILLCVLVLTLMPSALWRGSTAGADSDFWIGLVGVIMRGGIAAFAIAIISLAVSTITRSTVGGVIALLGYIAVSPSIGATFLKGFRPFDLTENMAAFANGGEVGRFVGTGDGYYQSVYAHGGGVALLFVALYVAIAIALGMAVFTRRDID
jgi:ABC-type transport system involved in multi-copper enzyme maturation permease subunit